MLEIRHLQMFSALARYRSLSATAVELNCTASAVSHQLRDLEHYYDIALVDRRTRPIKLTPAGEVVLRLANNVLPQVARSKADIRRLAHGQAGRLRLASECHSCFDWLMPILNEYRKAYSDVELDFATGFEPEPHQMLLDDEIDLLITASNLPIDGLHYVPLFTYESRLVLSPAHALASRDAITPDDLADQTLIAYPVEQSRLDVMAKFLEPAGIKPKAVRTTELTAMLIQLVASERGVAALPDWVAAEYEKKGWVVSRPLGDGVHCQLYASVRENSRELAYMKGFLALLDGIAKP
ncbi:LysR family transcriptional regulator [Moraxella caviae]|uniref:HTH-type transcriptional regulator MetR n=1 Tax=Moraxella caviae TaxID=34060 RepID=A0A1T0ACG8_9GAMM|nr:LysR family transcriptional regulator [Moraxella caviae]OOR93433.1 LysR family transcriptional regulator [Moraxella caviae]STZ14092.1 Cyn operon transcriptional activator [Moraxella caviae]